LEDFIKLANASDEQIRDYAREWGVLEICEHGYPRTHNGLTWPRAWSTQNWCNPLKHKDGMRQCYEEGWEPTDRWRYFASQAGAILKIAARVNQGSVALAHDWKLVYQEYLQEFDSSPNKLDPQDVLDNRRLISFAVNDWLQLGAVRPQFVWKAKSPKLEVGGPTLFGHLAVQLTLVVSQTGAVLFCSHCANPYQPRRQPNPNRRNFCKTCQINKVPMRFASQDYRNRRRRGPKLKK
jgi:hypothetical protein